MADATTAAGTPADPAAAGQPQAGVTGTSAAAITGTQADPTGTPSSEPMSLEEAKKLRAEANSLRKRLADLEAAQKAADDAKLSEQEKVARERDALKAQNDALRTEQQQYRLARVIAQAAASLNLVDPDAVQVLLVAGGQVHYDADGNPQGVVALIEQLVAQKPYLVASNVVRPPAPPSSGGATNPGRSSAPPPAAARPDPKEVYKQFRQSGGLSDKSIWKNGRQS